MASQTHLQIAHLFENHEIRFVQEPSDRLKCVICRTILKNAKQTSCGCKVCEICINKFLKDGDKPCPSKQSECADTKLSLSRDIYQDNATNKEIFNLKIFCPFTSCDSNDLIRNMVSHIEVCDYREVACNECTKKYPHREKLKHDQNMCSHRMVDCPHCHITMMALRLDTVHLNIDSNELCAKYSGDCPNECGAKNVLIKDHLKECKNQRMECPFQSFLCNSGKMTKSNLSKHFEDEFVPHVSFLMEEIRQLKKSNASLSEINGSTEALLLEQMRINQDLTDSRLKIERSLEDLKRRGPGSVEKSVVFRSATFIWKICNFESLRSDAENSGRTSLTSEPFYTSEFGYKMCLRIYPAGDGVGRNSHLSVFFALMKGEFDDLLAWPFKQKVTLSLLDQESNGTKNHSDTFKPDARSPCYQKPIDECNVASGSPKFITLASLLHPSLFCRQDVLFIKISVDPVGMSRP